MIKFLLTWRLFFWLFQQMEFFGQIPDRAIEDGTIGWFGSY